MAKKKYNPKLAKAVQGVMENPVLKHMRDVAYNVSEAQKRIMYDLLDTHFTTGSDLDAKQKAEVKRLRKQQKRIGVKVVSED